MSKQQQPNDPNTRVVCRNRRASHEYELLEQLECGIALYGSEVKSIRNNKISIEEAYVRVLNNEVWLLNCDIAEYPQANYLNHEPRRDRKLLLHKRQIRKFASGAEESGFALIPLEVYLLNGIVKIKVALAKGKKLHDKREALKQKTADREMRQALGKRIQLPRQ